MTMDVIRKTLSYDKTSVYFFDENQILIDDESGGKAVFKSEAERSGTEFEFISLSGFFRMIDGDKYGSFVDGLFSKSNYSNPGEYDLRLFDNINNMIDDLKRKEENGNTRIALLASYTFSDGTDQPSYIMI